MRKVVTFKDLRKIVSASNNQQQGQTTLFSSRLLNKPFWIWNIEEHKLTDIITNGDCCFNHIIGLSKKNTQDMPFFDYEKILFDNLQQHKHIWIKKATGLGITEFMLRYMSWLCLRNNNLKGTTVFMTNYYPSKSKIKYWVRVSIQKIRNPLFWQYPRRETSMSAKYQSRRAHYSLQTCYKKGAQIIGCSKV
jgi:hypothetical protein